MNSFDPNYADPAFFIPLAVMLWILFAGILIIQKGSAKMRARRRRIRSRQTYVHHN